MTDRLGEVSRQAGVCLAVVAAIAFGAGPGCGADDSESGTATTDTTVGADTSTGVTDAIAGEDTSGADGAGPADTSAEDTVAAPDTSTEPDLPAQDVSQDAGDTTDDTGPDARTLSSKQDGLLVPVGIARRSDLALSRSAAVWVERDTDGGDVRVMLWELDLLAEPRRLPVPYLTNPRQLALSENWLAFTDDRYGDADVFAYNLETGVTVDVATNPGAQEHPDLAGSVITWQDCRTCPRGAPQPSDVFVRDLDGALATRVTTDQATNERPVLGELRGGDDADIGVAWAVDRDSLRTTELDGSNLSAWPTASAIDGVAMTQGYLAWRARPYVINPDSMIPSDLYLTDLASGAVTVVSVHHEIALGRDAVPVADAGRVAWIHELAAASPPTQEVQVYSIADAAITFQLDVQGMDGVAIGGDRVGFIAPHPGNDGLPDVWIAEL